MTSSTDSPARSAKGWPTGSSSESCSHPRRRVGHLGAARRRGGSPPVDGRPAPTETRTVDEVLTAMSEHYAAAAPWSPPSPRRGQLAAGVEALHRELDDLEATAERAGARRPNELRPPGAPRRRHRHRPYGSAVAPSDALVNLRATVERSVSALRAALGAKQKLEEELRWRPRLRGVRAGNSPGERGARARRHPGHAPRRCSAGGATTGDRGG